MTYNIFIFHIFRWHTVTFLEFFNIHKIRILVFYFFNVAFLAMNISPNTRPDPWHMRWVRAGLKLNGKLWVGFEINNMRPIMRWGRFGMGCIRGEKAMELV